MGLFSPNYNKPGKGVSKDEPQKKGFFLFWEILWRKFSKILGANSMYALISIIWLVPVYLIIFFFAGADISSLLEKSIDQTAAAQGTLMFVLAFSVMIIVLWGSGPISASHAYIMRCFTREEHVWVMSDGKDKFKENFKQSIIVGIIDLLMLFLSIVAVRFYFIQSNKSWMFMFAGYIMVIVFIIYTWMHFYIYQIMVTFACKTKDLFKNSLFFALGKMPMNLLLNVISLVIMYFAFTYLQPIFAFIIMMIFGLCLTRFPIEFYAARTIKKNIVDNMPQKKYDEVSDSEPVFDDDIAKRMEDRK